MRQWTPQQKVAIHADCGPLLVTAAAGSGKTSVLTERIIRLLQEERVDIDRLLVVTFTRAAAAEMQERIGSKLADLVVECPTDPFLTRQQMRLPRANISTIHSFCMTLIRENFREAGVECDFRLMDDAEYKILKWETVDELFEELYQEKNPGFLQLADLLSGDRDDNGLRSCILELYDFLSACDDKEAWLRRIRESYGGSRDEISDESVEFWACKATELATQNLTDCVWLTMNAIKLTQADEELTVKYLSSLQKDGDFFQTMMTLLSQGEFDEAVKQSAYTFPRFGNTKNADPITKEKVSDWRGRAKTLYSKTAQRLLSFSKEKIREDINVVRPMALAVTDILQRLDDRLREEKYALNALTFDDLEQLTLTLLTERDGEGNRVISKRGKEVAQRFEEVMVDEYQDTNPAQALIYHILSDEGRKLFMVGDAKQAIYAFRNATPEDYIRKKDSYAPYQPEAPTFPAKVVLSANFRSHAGVVDAVNFLFERVCTPSLGGIVYDGDEHLIPSNPRCFENANAPHVQFHFVEDLQDMGKYEQECEFIARRIEALMKEGIVVPSDDGGERPLDYGDIAVLSRSVHPVQPLSRALERRNIPLVSQAGEKLLDAHEIKVVLSLLKILDNPYDDVSLAAVLLSPVFGFTPDELARIRIEQRSVAFYEALRLYGEAHGDTKIASFLEQISLWRKASSQVSADRLLLRIYADTSLDVLLSDDKGYRRVKGNLDLLVGVAGTYASTGQKGLASFLRYLEKAEERGTKIPAATSDESDGVRMMTIHGSKGLEFPVVFLIGSDNFNREDLKKRCLVHRHYGFGCRIRNGNTYYSTLPRNILQSVMRQEQSSEELRILYVAMTRASQYLITCSSVKHLARTVSGLDGIEWYEELFHMTAEKAESFASWLLMAACLHPDGKELCRLGELQPSEPGTGRFPLLVTYETADSFETTKEREDRVTEEVLREEVVYSECTEADGLFEENYPFEGDTHLPTKVSASALSHQAYLPETKYIRPRFASGQGDKLHGAQAGTAIHLFMSLVDLASDTPLQTQLDRLVSTERMTLQEAQAVSIPACEQFLASPLGQRIRQAARGGTLYREYPFVCRLPASEVTDVTDTEELVLVRGTVDLLFLEDGHPVLVDFKSDHVKRVEELQERYETQLSLYARALSSLFGKEVKERYLWSFTHNCALMLPLRTEEI